MQQPLTLFDRAISRPRSPASLATLGAILVVLPFVFAALDGVQQEVFRTGLWRNMLVQPVVILYVVLIAPLLDRMGDEVVASFRPLVDLDAEQYANLVAESSSLPRWHELAAILVGVLLGWASLSRVTEEPGIHWLSLYWGVSTCIMFGLLAWTVYVSFAGTRLTAAIHKHVIHIDLFDLTPFQAIGRQSLALALAFMGGILLSLIFGTQPQSYLAAEFWISYAVMGVVPVLIFFLNMLPTHRLISKEKKRRLQVLDARLRRLIGELEATPVDAAIPGPLGAQFSALAAYEQRLQNARTWPYNTAQLRTVFFTILLPAATMLARLFIENQFQ